MALSKVLSAVLAVAATLVGACPASAADFDYYWRWSDGSKATVRTFDQSHFPSARSLPRIRVTSNPPIQDETVRLEFWLDGSWRLESTARTNGEGVAEVAVNPLCSSNLWCDQVMRYRLRIDGQSAPLKVIYHAKASSGANSFS